MVDAELDGAPQQRHRLVLGVVAVAAGEALRAEPDPPDPPVANRRLALRIL
ncbi:hypothetical protein GCM10009743_19000 [Kribbella swartbergensis]